MLTQRVVKPKTINQSTNQPSFIFFQLKNSHFDFLSFTDKMNSVKLVFCLLALVPMVFNATVTHKEKRDLHYSVGAYTVQ